MDTIIYTYLHAAKGSLYRLRMNGSWAAAAPRASLVSLVESKL